MAFFHTLFNIGLTVIMFRILREFNRYMAYGYISSALFSTLLLALGGILLLLLVPLSDLHVNESSLDNTLIQALVAVSTKGNFYAYQLGMSIWGVGGLMLCYLLIRSRAVPKFLPIWGYIGYVIFIAGTLSEILGYGTGLYCSIPGGLFEIFLSVWLIVKGFNEEFMFSSTYAGEAVKQAGS